jgi:hypothetical protein
VAAAINRVYQSYGVKVGQAMVAIAQPDTEAQVFRIEHEELMEYWQSFQERLALFRTLKQ